MDQDEIEKRNRVSMTSLTIRPACAIISKIETDTKFFPVKEIMYCSTLSKRMTERAEEMGLLHPDFFGMQGIHSLVDPIFINL